MNLKTQKKVHKNEEGFTLVEVIAVLVILGILAAVAVPKFFDMQATARTKALEGAIGELNGQVALAFAQNALTGGTAGEYSGLSAYIGEDFNVVISGTETVTTDDFKVADLPAATGPAGTIEIDGQSGSQVVLTWNIGSTDSPGFFSIP